MREQTSAAQNSQVLLAKSASNVDPHSPWPFFKSVIKLNTSAQFSRDFEMDHSKDLKYT
jgi:hypothetical protein